MLTSVLIASVLIASVLGNMKPMLTSVLICALHGLR